MTHVRASIVAETQARGRWRRRSGASRLGSLSPLALLPLLLLLLVSSWWPPAPLLLRCHADIHTDPEYTYAIRHEDGPLQPLDATSPIAWTPSNVSFVDDGPYDTVTLPEGMSFPYWFGSHRSVAVDPNGALHLPAPPQRGTCCDPGNTDLPADYPCSFFFTWQYGCSCCFDNNYYDLIAVSLTDQHPAAAAAAPVPPGSTVPGVFYGHRPGQTSFFVKYVRVPLYISRNTPNASAIPDSSFDVELRAEGTVVMRYTRVHDPLPYAGWTTPRVWMVGLRQGNPASGAAALASNPASLSTRHREQWGSTNGTYPPRSEVRSDASITYYPFGSVACNSPSFGDLTKDDQHTWVFLNDFAGHAAQRYQFVCVFNENRLPATWPMSDALYNATLGAWRCDVPNRQARNVVLQVHLAEKGKEHALLPLTPMHYTYYGPSDAQIAAYEGLGQYAAGGTDLRLCYECARMRPQLCQAPTIDSLCNTPQIGSVAGGTSTAVLAQNYPWEERLASGSISRIWCVWSQPLASPSTYFLAKDPHGLNPFFHNVSWVPARLFPNTSWIVCDPPSDAPWASLTPGTRFNLSLAANNFVFAGALGAVGAGWGGPDAVSPLGIGGPASAHERSKLESTVGNKHLLMSVTLADPTDPELVAYESQNYLDHYLQSPGANFSAEVAARSGLNLARLCADCGARLADLTAPASPSSSTSAAASNKGLCMDAGAAGVALCLSPSLGDDRGASVAGDNATFTLFTLNYPTHVRRSLFDLRCFLSPFERRNVSTTYLEPTLSFTQEERDYTVRECDGAGVCRDVTTRINYTTPVTVYVTRYNYSIQLVAVGDAISVPVHYDERQRLYSCAAPPLADFGLEALQTTYPNISLSSVLVHLGENNRPLGGVAPAGLEWVQRQQAAQRSNSSDPPPVDVVYTYVSATDPELVRYGSARAAVPPLPPWSSCFSCASSFAPVVPGPISSLGVTSRGASHCFQSSSLPSLLATDMCISPSVGGMEEEAGAFGPPNTQNSSVQVYTSSSYPVAVRAGLAQLYCVFAPPLAWKDVFNATTNITTRVPLAGPEPFYSRVASWDASRGLAACAPPLWSVFRVPNLTLSLSEYGLALPFAGRTYDFVEEDDERLMLWREFQAELSEESDADAGADVDRDARFSPQQFCTFCHGTRVSVPGFTPYSPTGVAGLCFLDCARRWNGRARFDHCGACTGGTSGHEPNSDLDCMGVCGGPFLAENVTDVVSGTVVERCTCEGRAECFNITTQPLVGVSTTPPIPGQPQLHPLNDAAVSSAQFLMRSFPLPLSGGSGSAPSPLTDPTLSHTADPDFSDPRFRPFAPSTWMGSGGSGGFGVDPYPVGLGFTFPFFEHNYTTLYLSSSGALLFTPVSSLPAACKSFPTGGAAGAVDPRVKNTPLLATLQNDPSFERGCAAAQLFPYFTFLDPTANISSPFPGAFPTDAQPSNASAASIALMYGNSSSNALAPESHRAGAFVSIKFENVPYNWPSFSPWLARFAPAPLVSQARPPLYSFQVTLYETGRVSLKHFAVRDPAGSDDGDVKPFNTTDLYRTLVVGLVDRPLPASTLTQGAPAPVYLEQLRHDQNAQLGLQGALAIARQRQWIPGSVLPVGVFPPRAVVASTTHHVFCPFALNACAYPSRGPAEGGTPVSLSLWNLGVDRGCITRILSLQCLFGSEAAPSQARYDPLTDTLRCTSPPGPAHSTVPLLLMEGNQTVITSNKLFWTWLPRGDRGLLVLDYENPESGGDAAGQLGLQRGNLTRLVHIRGAADAAGSNETESEAAFALHMCETCSSFNARFCRRDCNGDFFGSAFTDECGNCTSGMTGRTPGFARDCAGRCFGASVLRPVTVAGGTVAQQCACAPATDDALCQAAAAPALSPAPTYSKQYVYNVQRLLSADASTSDPGAPPPIPWDSFPAHAVSFGAPLPQYLPIDLPFLFPFFSQSLRRAHLSAWGGVLLGTGPPSSSLDRAHARDSCLAGGMRALFQSNGSTVCPFHMLAVSVAHYDLDAPGSTITYWTSEGGGDSGGSSGNGDASCLTIVWSNMLVQGNHTFPYTFAAQLCETGLVRMSYLRVQDPHPDGRAAAAAAAASSEPAVPFVPSALVQREPAPLHASEDPFWLAGIMQSWHVSGGVQVRPGSTDASWPGGAPRILQRAPVVPFPYEPGAAGVGSIRAQRAFIPSFVAAADDTALGSFPPRTTLALASGSAWQYCLLGVDLCPSVNWGPLEGGTRVRLFGNEWGCVDGPMDSNGTLSRVCCASSLRLSCQFGGVSVPAVFDPVIQAVECVSPPGAVINSSVALTLHESGRRIGTRPNLFFVYNISATELDAALAAPLVPAGIEHASPLANLSQWYNTDASACGRCATLLPASQRASFCTVDCHGDFRGTATLDSCGVCSGGRSGHAAESDRDCRGECFGPFRTVQASDFELLAAHGPDGATRDVQGQCVCVDDVARLGFPSCGYFPVDDGLVQASQVLRLAPYQYFLLSLAFAGCVSAAAWQLALWIKAPPPPRRVRAVQGFGPEDGAAPQPPPPPAPLAAAARRAQREVAEGMMGAAGGIELQPRPRRNRHERGAAEAAAAAAPAMSPAAAAAMEDSVSDADRPPAAHYRYDGEAGGLQGVI